MTRRVGGSGLVLALVVAGTLAFAVGARAEDDCAACHEAVVKTFAKTGHGKAWASGKEYASASCVSCHRGAAEHAASGGEKKPASLKVGPKAGEACLACHDGSQKQAHWQGSAHERAGLVCASCHDPHESRTGTPTAPKGLPGASPTTKRCLECHGGVRVSLNQRSSHPLKDGAMDCASCHDAHGTSNEKLLRQASVNDLCYSCHQNMRGPFLWEHSPVREGCLTCHKAHGSNNPKLLQARITQLCQSCHQQGRHQTIPGVPASIWVDNKACLNCHQQIHGTNHPSGPLFQR
jgi:DmsE family decaheme c-type cytochrome